MVKKMTNSVSNASLIRDCFVNRPLSLCQDFYLSGRILEASQYNEWFDIIRNANKDDIIRIHINSPGGDLFTAIQFLRAMGDCRGTIISSVEGLCASAATLIFLMSDGFEISDHSSFMFHNYSTGLMGKGGELLEQVTYESKWATKIFNDCYGDFLKKKEIELLMVGKDFWLDGDDVEERLKKRSKKIEKENKRLVKQQNLNIKVQEGDIE